MLHSAAWNNKPAAILELVAWGADVNRLTDEVRVEPLWNATGCVSTGASVRSMPAALT